MPGGSVNITCVAVGSPMPYVKWMLGSEDLTPEDEMPIGRNVLELNGVRESANYTCVAMSSLGIIESTAQVLVKSKGRSNHIILSLREREHCGKSASVVALLTDKSSLIGFPLYFQMCACQGNWIPLRDGIFPFDFCPANFICMFVVRYVFKE